MWIIVPYRDIVITAKASHENKDSWLDIYGSLHHISGRLKKQCCFYHTALLHMCCVTNFIVYISFI